MHNSLMLSGLRSVLKEEFAFVFLFPQLFPPFHIYITMVPSTTHWKKFPWISGCLLALPSCYLNLKSISSIALWIRLYIFNIQKVLSSKYLPSVKVFFIVFFLFLNYTNFIYPPNDCKVLYSSVKELRIPFVFL